MKKSSLPENFEVTARIMELAKQNNWPDPMQEVDAFKDYHLAHGSLMADWEAAFRTWLRNAKKWRPGETTIRPGSVRTKSGNGSPVPALPALTLEQRQENQRRVQEIIASIGNKGIK